MNSEVRSEENVVSETPHDLEILHRQLLAARNRIEDDRQSLERLVAESVVADRRIATLMKQRRWLVLCALVLVVVVWRLRP